MRRIMVLVTVAAVMVAMLAFVPGPAIADDDVDVEEVFFSGDEVCVIFEVEEDGDEEDEVVECEDVDDFEDIDFEDID